MFQHSFQWPWVRGKMQPMYMSPTVSGWRRGSLPTCVPHCIHTSIAKAIYFGPHPPWRCWPERVPQHWNNFSTRYNQTLKAKITHFFLYMILLFYFLLFMPFMCFIFVTFVFWIFYYIQLKGLLMWNYVYYMLIEFTVLNTFTAICVECVWKSRLRDVFSPPCPHQR